MMTCMHFQSPSSKGERVVGAARDPFRVFVFSVLPLNEPDFLTTRPGPGRNRAPTMLPGQVTRPEALSNRKARLA